ELPHVGEIRALLASAKLAPADAVAGRALQDRLVDVGDVLDVADRVTRGPEEPRDQIERQERAGVTEVRGVVWRDAADLQREVATARGDGSDRATASVVQTEHALRTISSRPV